MSLTNPFGIQQNEIKNIIKEFCPEKESFRSQNGTTCFNTKKECMVPSSLDSSDANLCGTAFDYIARFFIAQKISNNKFMATKELMAENIFSYRYFRQININIHKIQKSGICIKNTNSIVCGNLSKWLEKECNINKYKIENLCDAGILKVSYINTADLDDLKLQYDKFIEPIKKFIVSENNDEGMIIEKSIILAKLEQIVRSSKDYVNIDNMYCFSDKYSKVKEELYKLLDSFKKVFLPIVKKDSVVIFNPRFGIGSQVIGGADADIFIDGILYDFKVVKKNGWSSKNVTQIVGYYILNSFAKTCEDINSDLHNKTIEKLALYIVRYEEVAFYDCKNFNEHSLKNAIHRIIDIFVLYNVFYWKHKHDDIIDKFSIPLENDSCFDWNEQLAEELIAYNKKIEKGYHLSGYEKEDFEKYTRIKERITNYIQNTDTISILKELIKNNL